jgi:predicted aldo/keto reductase-like oxidoreductase
VNAPILLLHGALDFKVPVENAYDLYNALIQSNRYQDVDYNEVVKKETSHKLSERKSCVNNNQQCEAPIPMHLKIFPQANHNTVHEAANYVPMIANYFRYVESDY